MGLSNLVVLIAITSSPVTLDLDLSKKSLKSLWFNLPSNPDYLRICQFCTRKINVTFCNFEILIVKIIGFTKVNYFTCPHRLYLFHQLNFGSSSNGSVNVYPPFTSLIPAYGMYSRNFVLFFFPLTSASTILVSKLYSPFNFNAMPSCSCLMIKVPPMVDFLLWQVHGKFSIRVIV